jgi:hypothetical protein
MDGPGLGERAPRVLVIEDRPRLAREYRHVFDYLAIRVERIGTAPELVAALAAAAPIAVIWNLPFGPDPQQVARALADLACVPLLIVGDDDEAARACQACARHGAAPTPVAGAHSRDIIEFLFRAGRLAGQLRVLAV